MRLTYDGQIGNISFSAAVVRRPARPTMTVRRRLIVVAAVVLSARLAAFESVSQGPPTAGRAPTQTRAGSNDYFTLLDMYRTGDAHLAVTELIHLKRNKVPPVEVLTRQASDRLRALMIMHLEALVESGTVEPHASIAIAALVECRGRPAAPDDFTRSAAIVLASALLPLGGFPTEGEKAAVLRAGGLSNPEILLLAGAIIEWRALDTMSQRGENAGILVVTGSQQESLVPLFPGADAGYRAALEADPDLVEARVRLGRVYWFERRFADARRELEQARAEATVPSLAYLSALFLGQLEEHDKRYDAAVQCYEDALRRYPGALTASLGLGHALEMKGESERAWTVVRRALVGSVHLAEPAPDPWPVYSFAQYWQIERRLDALRRSVRQ